MDAFPSLRPCSLGDIFRAPPSTAVSQLRLLGGERDATAPARIVRNAAVPESLSSASAANLRRRAGPPRLLFVVLKQRRVLRRDIVTRTTHNSFSHRTPPAAAPWGLGGGGAALLEHALPGAPRRLSLDDARGNACCRARWPSAGRTTAVDGEGRGRGGCWRPRTPRHAAVR